jgi:hypothetical protein
MELEEDMHDYYVDPLKRFSIFNYGSMVNREQDDIKKMDGISFTHVFREHNTLAMLGF